MIEKQFENRGASYCFGSVVPPSAVSFSLSRRISLDKNMIVLKYSTLLAVARDVVVNESSSSSPGKAAANFLTVARSWLTFVGKDEYRGNVGAELNTSFDATLASYLNELVAAGFSASTVRDRKSVVKRLHAVYQTQVSILRNERSSEIGTELRRILLKASMSTKELSLKARVSRSFIQRTLGGSRPQFEAGLKNFSRIEALFLSMGVIKVKGHFLDLLRNTSSTKITETKRINLSQLSVEEANQSFTSKSQSPLKSWSLKDIKEKTPLLYDFLERFLEYKKQERAWVLKVPSRKDLSSSVLWAFRHNGKIAYAPSFSRYLTALTAMLSFSMHCKNKSISVLNNPLIFAEKGFYIDYIDFLAERREGKIKGAGLIVLALASEITKELARQFKLGLAYGQQEHPGFDHVASEVRHYFRRFSNSGRVHDPSKRLAPFFELNDPASPLVELSRQLSEKAMVPQTFIAHAADLRDSFLIAFLLCVPIRERTCIQLNYRSDNTGHLRFSSKEQAWRVEIPPNLVKNQRPVSRTLPTFLNSLIERYLSEARPRLLHTWGDAANNIELLFVCARRNCKSTQFKDECTGELYELTQGQMPISARLGVLTKKAFGLSIRAHAFRHITATRFLKLNPGQYQACADLLADSVETVMKHYAYHDASWNEKLLNESISNAFLPKEDSR